MTTDEIMLFDKWPNVLPLYAALREKLLSAYPEMTVKAAKTQISFRNRHVFAMASPPWRRLRGAPESYLLVSFGLSHRSDSPRVWQRGRDIPRPIMVRQSTMPSGGWSMAAPMACPRNGALHGVETVSYTHLDVYKRQEEGLAGGRPAVFPAGGFL